MPKITVIQAEDADSEYSYRDSLPTHSNHYLWKPLLQILSTRAKGHERIFEIGCGNGATAGMLSKCGFGVTAIDSSKSGIQLASAAFPEVSFHVASAYEPLQEVYGTHEIVICLEVVEHCFYPAKLARTAYQLTAPGGIAVFSTPFHGYFKNLALALTNHFDGHWGALWEGGHVKFFSMKTLKSLLANAGFERITFVRVGRVPALAKSMIAIAHRPRSS